MKKILWGVLAVLAGALFLSGPVSAVESFSFSSFDADYYLGRDENKTSVLNVKETLVAEFSDYSTSNHGIERAIPENYKFDSSARTETHSFNLTINNVTGGPVKERSEGGMRILRIGDPDSYARGEKTYTVDWSATNVTRNFDDGDEFYWKANGDGWSQRFLKVTARVHIPADLVSQLDGRVKCGIGDAKTTDYDVCATSVADESGGGKVYAFTSMSPIGVAAGESLTFDIGFKPGTFAEPGFDLAAVMGVSSSTMWWIVIGAGLLTIMAIIWIVVVCKKFRPYKTNRSIVPEYLPPRDLSVVESTVWWKKNDTGRVFPAAVINLAVNHYVQIYEIKRKLSKKNDYGIKLLKAPDNNLSDDDITLLSNLFDDDFALGSTVELKDLSKNTSTSMQLKKMAPDAIKRLRKEKQFYRVNPAWVGVVTGLAIFAILGVLVWCISAETALPLVFLPALILVLIGDRLFDPISEKGAVAKDYLKGLEMYMKVGEAERLKILQSVKGAERMRALVGEGKEEVQIVKLYERLMPYAVIFGITKDWAQVLQVHYEADASLVPAWYVGANLAAFNAVNFASAMNSFTTNSYVAGAGSISSGGSGFSGGGGFAGGGGGGGGGGGW